MANPPNATRHIRLGVGCTRQQGCTILLRPRCSRGQYDTLSYYIPSPVLFRGTPFAAGLPRLTPPWVYGEGPLCSEKADVHSTSVIVCLFPKGGYFTCVYLYKHLTIMFAKKISRHPPACAKILTSKPRYLHQNLRYSHFLSANVSQSIHFIT